MCVVSNDIDVKQAGWLLLAVLVVVLLVAAGAVMLMAQAHLGLRSVQQEHQTLQDDIDKWSPLLTSRESNNGE